MPPPKTGSCKISTHKITAVTSSCSHSTSTNKVTVVSSHSTKLSIDSCLTNITAVNSHSTSPNITAVKSFNLIRQSDRCQQSPNQHHSCQQVLAQPTTLQVSTYNHSSSINKVAAANSHPAKYGCKQSFNWNQQSHTCQQISR